jgi:transposase
MVVADTLDWADGSEAERFAFLWRRFCKLACLFFLAVAVLRCFQRQLLGLHVYLVELRRQLVELRLQANFWRAQHQRAVQREANLAERNRHLQGEIREWKRRLFGRKSESSSSTNPAKPTDPQPHESEATSSTPSTNTTKPRRSRGQQPGSKGHGRRAHDHLPTTHEPCVLPESQQRCAECGEPFE